MDAKKVAAVVVCLIVIIAALLFLFIGDATDNTVLKIGSDKYSIDDFLNYVKVWNYENSSNKDDIDSSFNQYQVYKIYTKRAYDTGLTLNESEKPTLESGDEEILLADYNLKAEDYLKVKEEMALCEKLYTSPYEYGKVPENVSEQYLDYMLQNGKISNKNLYTYDFRVIEVDNEMQVEESGDLSGDTNKVDPNVKSKEIATKLLAYVKEHLSGDVLEAELDEIVSYSGESVSGDIFTQIATKLPANRYIQNGNSFNAIENGGLDQVSSFYLETDYSDSSTLVSWGLVSPEMISGIRKGLSSTKKGEFSDLFDTGNGYAFVYVEDKVDGLSENDQDRLNNEASNYYIEVTSNMTHNKALVNSIVLENIIPKVKREKEEAQNNIDSGDNEILQFSGDVVEILPNSGE